MTKVQRYFIWFAFKFFSPIFPRTMSRFALRLFLTPFRFERPQWEKDIISQTKGPFDRAKYSYHIYGDSGPMVLFVHGWAGRGSQFGHYGVPLLKAGMRAVFFDGPAHFGLPGQKTDIGEFAQAIIDCQKELGPFRAVVAHSFGGAASGLALKLGLLTEKIVLLATPASSLRVLQNFYKLISLHPRSQKYFLKTMEERVGMSINEASIVSFADKMTTPLLVVHDPEDKEVKYLSALEFKERWPGATVYSPQQVGHYRILKDSAVIQKVVEFIASK